MSLSSLALDPCWRDYFGAWTPSVEPYLAPLADSLCHAPRLALVPDQSKLIVPASGKITYNFHLVPGSCIWGFWLLNGAGALQITDVDMGHKFFQEPASVSFLFTAGADWDRMVSYTALPAPHPVVGDGLFTMEYWDSPGALFFLLLGVAEVTKCPVR